ncbi:MAG: FecR domain-containing protein [Cyanobacteria bacterium J06639_1]
MSRTRSGWKGWLGSFVLAGAIAGAPAIANRGTLLTRAEVYKLVNQVELIPKNQQPRPAQLDDILVPLDSLATKPKSRADLLFNEGSLARLGANSIFRFVPGTRNFELDSGTTIVMFPPGSEGGTVITPDAVVESNGSIVWVKHDATTQETFIGALVESTSDSATAPVTVRLKETGETFTLQVGERLTIAPDATAEVMPLHLSTFHQVCKLASGLGPGEAEAIATESPAARTTLQSTRKDTMQALDRQEEADTFDPATAALCQPKPELRAG